MATEDIYTILDKSPTKEEAQKILKTVIVETQNHTRPWLRKYKDLDTIFLERGFDIGGFQSALFLEHGLKKHDLDDTDKIGTIFQNLEKQGANYLEHYPKPQAERHEEFLFGHPRKLPSEIIQFMNDLRDGKGGDYGKQYYKAINSFFDYKDSDDRKIRKGPMIWKILWAYCWNCRYLQKNYDSSLKVMVERKADEWLIKNGYGDEIISSFPSSNLAVADWESLLLSILESMKTELRYVGIETAPWILRDVEEFGKAGRVLMKFDVTNHKFLMKTGIMFMQVKEGIQSLEELKKTWNKSPKTVLTNIIDHLKLEYNFPTINRSIYAYTSVEEAKYFGYCRTKEACERCKVNEYCYSGKSGTAPLKVVEGLRELGFR